MYRNRMAQKPFLFKWERQILHELPLAESSAAGKDASGHDLVVP